MKKWLLSLVSVALLATNVSATTLDDELDDSLIEDYIFIVDESINNEGEPNDVIKAIMHLDGITQYHLLSFALDELDLPKRYIVAFRARLNALKNELNNKYGIVRD